MPLSGRPFLTTRLIFSPSTSALTSFDRVRSGPLSPPPASRPWQKEQSWRKSAAPFWTRSCEYFLGAAVTSFFTPLVVCVLGLGGVCAAQIAKLKSKAANNVFVREVKRRIFMGTVSVALPAIGAAGVTPCFL